MPTLSVILPTYNECDWLPETIAHLRTALLQASWPDVEILIVDDGSTDATEVVLAADVGDPPLTVLRIANSGRMVARRSGLGAATGELVVFLDSRVHVHPGSLRFLLQRLDEDPEAAIWNGHAVTASGWQPWTRFWDGIVFIAWRRYLRNPRTTSYGEDEFDWFPKGTTFFAAPREWLIAATDSVKSLSGDPKLANDDTLMIRNLLEFGRINISPEFSCTYHPRSTFRTFLRSAYHRGSVLVDGHLRPGLRLYRPFQAVLLALPIAGLWACRSPQRCLGAAIAGSATVGVAARVVGVPSADAASLGVLAVPFAAGYGAGIVRGFMARRSRKQG